MPIQNRVPRDDEREHETHTLDTLPGGDDPWVDEAGDDTAVEARDDEQGADLALPPQPRDTRGGPEAAPTRPQRMGQPHPDQPGLLQGHGLLPGPSHPPPACQHRAHHTHEMDRRRARVLRRHLPGARQDRHVAGHHDVLRIQDRGLAEARHEDPGPQRHRQAEAPAALLRHEQGADL
eukprot:753585-Hanusia_phi.AAC.6